MLRNNFWHSYFKSKQKYKKSFIHNVLHQDLTMAYQEMAADEEGEREALVWSEGVLGDLNDASR